MENVKDLFVDQNEQQVALLGGSYLKNFLAAGTVDKGFCVVTDKRVYFKGQCYYKVGNDYKTMKEERTVDIKDITGSGFTESRYFLLKILAIIGTVISVLWIISAFGDSSRYGYGANLVMANALTGSIPLAITWAAYFFARLKVFEISFAGGKIAFKASNYNETEIQNFQKQLRKAKDDYIPAPQYVVNVPTPAPSVSGSVADELKKLKELLDAGAISQEEYNDLKAKALK